MRVEEAVFFVCLDHEYCVGNGGCPLDRNNKDHRKIFCRDYDNPELIKILLDLGFELDIHSNIQVTEDSYMSLFTN